MSHAFSRSTVLDMSDIASDFFDDLGSSEPRCPECGAVMREIDERDGWSCPSCRTYLPMLEGPLPKPYDGPAMFGV
jgi:hypothetical protein